MEEMLDNVSIKSGASEEDFGFVKRDSKVLEKALTSSVGGNDEQQVPESSLNATGSEKPETQEDVTSATEQLSIHEDGALHSDEGGLTDGTGTRKLAGTLDDVPQLEQLGHVYDASKRKTTVASVSSAGSVPAKAPGPGILRKKMSQSSFPEKPVAESPLVTKEEDLPQTFQVKYLGQRDARGLWGIKHTRRPVDAMVAAAKNLKAGTVLPLVKLVVSKEGVSIVQIPSHKKSEEIVKFHAIDTISYGVQDLVYTRVFSMIVVKDVGDLKGQHPFECHAFVCDSRNAARKLTYALASAFHEYSKQVKASGGGEAGKDGFAAVKKKFAIDLRSPEEIEAELRSPHAEDSEA